MSTEAEIDSANILRIMVSTDNHLGFAEKDTVRGEDSFIAFEEMLELALTEDVDFILLGGDLFHDAVPSQNALHKCMKLLRMYTFGDKPVSVEFLSDGTQNFHNAVNESVNYQDPNLNISIPVYSIHGNHDDPSAFGGLSSLDLLSTTGLINYFGRWTDLTKIEISPILLRKGETQLALYGLSHIHDVRLTRLFESRKVNMQMPSEDSGEWFHLMVLHQNRADRGPKNYLPEESLPDFLNLIIWGHEHDCRIEPEYNPKRDFFVSQPGSSVPTSLAEGEALKKHVAILEIYKNKFQLKPLPLQTVRPFVFDSINVMDLSEELRLDEGDVSNKVRVMAQERIEAMLERSNELLTGHPKQPTLPTIRLRIVFNDEEQMFNAIRLGQMFNDRVANPADIIHFKKLVKREKKESVEFDKDVMKSEFKKMEVETCARVEDLVERYFGEVDESKSLKVLSTKALTEICQQLVDRKDHNAADNLVRSYKEKAVEYAMEKMPNEEALSATLVQFKENIRTDDILQMLEVHGSRTASIAIENKCQQKETDLPREKSDPVSNSGDAISQKTIKKNNATSPLSNGSRTSGKGRGARGSNNSSTSTSHTTRSSARSKHVMPKLDVSTSTRSTRQQSLFHLMEGGRKAVPTKTRVYEISDDSD